MSLSTLEVLDSSLREKISESLRVVSEDPLLLNLRRAIVYTLILKYVSNVDLIPDSQRLKRAVNLLEAFLSQKEERSLVQKALNELKQVSSSRENDEMLIKLMSYLDSLYETDLRYRKEGTALTEKDMEETIRRIMEVIEAVLPEDDARRVLRQIEAHL